MTKFFFPCEAAGEKIGIAADPSSPWMLALTGGPDMNTRSFFFPIVDESWKRFLGPDDASFLLERLGQGRIRQLWRWFESDGGLRSGMVLAQEAPVFDLLLERLCDDGVVSEDVAEEDPFSLPARLQGPEWAHALFGMGLMFGSSWRSAESGDPFATERTLADLVEHLAEEDWVARVRHDRDSGKPEGRNPIDVTLTLMRKEPLLELPIDALRKLVTGVTSAGHWYHELPGEARALFFLGAVAAGVEIPQQPREHPVAEEAEVSS
jgi:hypothetical protein